MTTLFRKFHALPALAVLAAAGPAVAAAEPPQGVLQLAASATAEITNDTLSIVFSTQRDGPDATAVQGALRQALDAALAEARGIAKPGAVEVQAGNFSLYPRYGTRGTITGWQGQAELRVEGRDMAAIGRLAGRIGTMTVARVGYSLSRAAREKAEADLGEQAVGRFRARASEMTRLFGYGTYSVREVSVSADSPVGMPAPMMRSRLAAAPVSADEALPVEPGQGSVTVTVSGSVQMHK